MSQNTPASTRGRNRFATLLAFVLLVIVGRQVTPQSSSAAEADLVSMVGESRPDWLDQSDSLPQQPGGYYVESVAAPFTVRGVDGSIVAQGLTSGELMARFPDLRPWGNQHGFGFAQPR